MFIQTDKVTDPQAVCTYADCPDKTKDSKHETKCIPFNQFTKFHQDELRKIYCSSHFELSMKLRHSQILPFFYCDVPEYSDTNFPTSCFYAVCRFLLSTQRLMNEPSQVLKLDNEGIWCKVHRNGNVFFVASSHTFYTYKFNNQKAFFDYRISNPQIEPITQVVMSRDYKYILILSRKNLKLNQMDPDYRLNELFNQQIHYINCDGKFSNDNRWLAIIGGLEIRLLDLNNNTFVKLPISHDKNILTSQFSPNSNWLVSGSRDGVVNVINLNEPSSFQFNFTTTVSSISFSSDSNFLAISSHGGEIVLYRLTSESCQILQKINIGKGVLDVSFSPNQKWFSYSDDCNQAHLFSFDNELELACVKSVPHNTVACSACFDETGYRLSYLPNITTAALLSYSESAGWNNVATINHSEIIIFSSFNNSGLLYLTSSEKLTVVYGEDGNGTWNEKMLIKHENGVRSVCFTDDSLALVLVSTGNNAQIIPFATASASGPFFA